VVEQRPFKPKVVGSIPTAPTNPTAIRINQFGTLRLPAYLLRTRVQEQRIGFPRSLQVRFELFLPRFHPWRIVFFRDSRRAMAEQDAHALVRRAFE
jgi:hypothetical protein